jgi:integrase
MDPEQHFVRADTIDRAKAMLACVLEQGATYREAGAPHGLARSTVERTVKALLLEIAREQGIPGLDEDVLASLTRLRQFREPIMQAVRDFEPSGRAPEATTLSPQVIAAGASRVRARSENANRDVALLYVLFCTGAKPVEIARLEVRDYLEPDGAVRERSELPAESAANGCGRPLYFTSARARGAVDAYLVERKRRKLGLGAEEQYRGLDPGSRLFLTESGRPFAVTSRGAGDDRLTCRLITAIYRSVFKRAGWTGVTAHTARRDVARRLLEKGADDRQVGELLGLSSKRSVRRLVTHDRPPLDALVRDLV